MSDLPALMAPDSLTSKHVLYFLLKSEFFMHLGLPTILKFYHLPFHFMNTWIVRLNIMQLAFVQFQKQNSPKIGVTQIFIDLFVF